VAFAHVGRTEPIEVCARGLIVGIAIFEKLVAVVLLGPLTLLLVSTHRSGWSGWMSATVGLLAGGAPLFLANLTSYLRSKVLVSLTDAIGRPGGHLDEITEYARQFLALGNGDLVERQVFGAATGSWTAEPVLILFLLIVVSVGALRFGRTERRLGVAGGLATAYGLVAIAMLLLPRGTYTHHWIQATPFHYGAVAAGLSGLFGPGAGSTRAWLKVIGTATMCALVMVRIVGVTAMEREIVAGTVSRAFDRSFTRLGEMAGERAQEAIFIAADWGTAVQIYCLANGQDGLVYEPFWFSDPAQATGHILEATTKAHVYVVTSGFVKRLAAKADVINRSITESPGWCEVPPEGEFSHLSFLRVRKFARADTAKAGAGSCKTARPSPRLATDSHVSR